MKRDLSVQEANSISFRVNKEMAALKIAAALKTIRVGHNYPNWRVFNGAFSFINSGFMQIIWHRLQAANYHGRLLPKCEQNEIMKTR